MTRITTMIQPLVPCNVRALPGVRSASENDHRIIGEKPFVTSTDVI